MSLPAIPGPKSRGRKGAGQVGLQLQEAGAQQAGGPSKENLQVCPGGQGLSHLWDKCPLHQGQGLPGLGGGGDIWTERCSFAQAPQSAGGRGWGLTAGGNTASWGFDQGS